MMINCWLRDVESAGYSFTCTWGIYESGAWLALINWGLCAELSIRKSDYKYNLGKIKKVLSGSLSESELETVAADLMAAFGDCFR